MIKRLLLLLALTVAPVLATTTQLVGVLMDGAGNVVNGTACFKLPVNAVDTSTGRALSPRSFCYPVTNGTFPAFATVVPNDVIQPLGTYYQARVTDQSGALVFAANYVITTGGGTFNIGIAIPTYITTTNISYLVPVLVNGNNVWTGTNAFAAGAITLTTVPTATNCASSAGTCGSAAAGMFTIDAGTLGKTVNDTAVTANSEILLQEDETLGTRLGVTCNIVFGRTYHVSARTPGSSFTVFANTQPITNPACLSYLIVN